MPRMPSQCIGKNVTLNERNVSQKCQTPILLSIIRPVIFGHQ